MSKIVLKNGVVLEYKDGTWYRNNEKIRDPHKYKIYNPKTRSYMGLGSNGKLEKYSYLKRLFEDAYKSYWRRTKEVVGADPSEDMITLKTKGNMNLADVPVNMLDSIAINTGRTNTNIKDNLGLVGKESTFGGHSRVLGNPWNTKDGMFFGEELTNNHSYFVTPEIDYYDAIIRSTNGNTSYAEKAAKQAYKLGLIKPVTPHYHNDVMADAFARYAANPQKYNPGQGNYVQMVTNIGNEVWNEPSIQEWWNNQGQQFYNQGLKERFSTMTPYKTPQEPTFNIKDLYNTSQKVEFFDKDGFPVIPKLYKK